MENKYTNRNDDEQFLSLPDKKNSFALPSSYFENLPLLITAKIEREEELSKYPVLAAISKELIFSVPKNYFVAKETALTKELELLSFPELTKLSKVAANPFPSDYLASNEKNILRNLESIEELSATPLLASIEKENKFAIDANYFDELMPIVKERMHKSNSPSFPFSDWITATFLKPKIIFAYSFVALLIISITFYLNRNNTIINDSGNCKTLACLEKNELLNEKTINDFDEDNLYEMVDVKNLDRRLSENKNADSAINN